MKNRMYELVFVLRMWLLQYLKIFHSLEIFSTKISSGNQPVLQSHILQVLSADPVKKFTVCPYNYDKNREQNIYNRIK
jgi:hypothetical protein